MNNIITSIRSYLFFTILLGLIYPLLLTGFAKGFFSHKANGSMIEHNGQIVGSELIAQKFEGEKHFKSRPSAVDYNPLPSGGSNSGPTGQSLKETFESRKLKLGAEASSLMLFASGSGLDPHIDLDTALKQVNRVAIARNTSPEKVKELIISSIEERQFGFLGEDRINVLKLNLALEGLNK